jgi:hypothetical protein
MALEALGLGLILFWIANAVHLSSHSSLVTAIPATIEAHSIGIASTDNGSMVVAPAARLATLMAFIGSGIYEEVFFRLILLLPAIAWATRLTNPKMGTVLGMLVVSVVFATLHYDIINPAGAEFELSSFFFRFTASIVFCVLFLFRGFGIAVGAHVAFDALTQLWLSSGSTLIPAEEAGIPRSKSSKLAVRSAAIVSTKNPSFFVFSFKKLSPQIKEL